MTKILKFPKDFLWGSAISSYQAEGGIEHCDWSKEYSAGKACDHYHRFEEDFDWLEKLNQNAFSFSIEWSRIEPEPGKFDYKEIEHYRKILLALKERNIRTFVTLWHYTNPVWLAEMGAWTNKEIVNYFEGYAKVMAEQLGDLVDFWVTLNEPMVYLKAYCAGRFPPFQKRNIFNFRKVFNNLIKAHQKGYHAIHEKKPEAQVGIKKTVSYFEPARNYCLIEKFIAFLLHYSANSYFLKRIENTFDYIGLQYYRHFRIVFYPPFFRNFDKRVNDIGWEIYPEGIYHGLKYLKRFGKPIYVTENGLADAQDKYRKEFIRDHLFWVYKAIEEGVDVRGYFHWSLIDNLEWEKGFMPRFGLIEIDYQTLERKPRPSAFYYGEISKNNSIKI